MYFGGFRDISVDGAVSGFVAKGTAGGITGGTSMATSLVPGALYWDGVGLYALRDLSVNAPITAGNQFQSVQLKSERDINLNADITSTYVLAANAARNINVTACTLEGGAGYTLGKTLPAGLYLFAGQRALTATDNAFGAWVNDGYGGGSNNIGAIYFNRTSSPTLLKSDTDVIAISGCTNTTNCIPSQRTDFLPANVLLESSGGTSGPVAGSVDIGGFHNMTPERWDPVAGAIANSLSAGAHISFNAFGNLTINETAFNAGGSLQLLAAGGNYGDPIPISGSTLADYAGIVYFTQPSVLLTATGNVDIRSGTDGTGASLGAAGGTMPGGGAFTSNRTNQARPVFNSVSNPNQVVIRYGSSANALGGGLTIDGFLNTVLTLQNNDGSAASNLTTSGIDITSYGDVVVPQHYIRALNGGSTNLVAGGNIGLVGQVKLTDPSPVVQAGFSLTLNSSADSTGRHLDFLGGTGSLTSGYGTGTPILLQYDPGWTSWALLNVNGFKNASIYVFANSVVPTLANFDPNVSLTIGTFSNFWSTIGAFGNVTLENNKLTGLGNGTASWYDSTSLLVTAGAGGRCRLGWCASVCAANDDFGWIQSTRFEQ